MATAGVGSLFKGCLSRFVSKSALVAVGRTLSRVDHSTRPWTEFEAIGFDTQDGFGDDIEIHTIRFTYHGKYPKPEPADTWLEQITGAFDDYTGLTVSGYTTSQVNRLPVSDPIGRVDDTGVYEAAAEYEIWLHRSTLLPPNRGA